MRGTEASSPVNGVHAFLKDKAGIPVDVKMPGCMSCPGSGLHTSNSEDSPDVHEDRRWIFLETYGFFEFNQNRTLGPD